MEETNKVSCIPEEVQAAYVPEGFAEIQVLSGGIINQTLKVTTAIGDNFILQRMSPIFDERLLEDYDVVTTHLEHEGWEVPVLRQSVHGGQSFRDESNVLWRAISFIDADPLETDTPRGDVFVALSGLLGKLHKSLSSLHYSPKFSIPHFHETGYYLERLAEVSPYLSTEDQIKAEKVEEAMRIIELPQHSPQLIHGDPQAHNALYRGSIPFTFIDYDTVMTASPLIDVGDMLRSVTAKLLKTKIQFEVEQLRPVIDEYHRQAEICETKKSFFNAAINAGQLISLELCARFLIDNVEDYYFDWDSDQYQSRYAHNRARAEAQLRVHRVLSTNY